MKGSKKTTARERAVRLAQQRLWRRTPRLCACERAIGVLLESGSQWVCADCARIERQSLERRLKFTNRLTVNAPYFDEYKLHLP